MTIMIKDNKNDNNNKAVDDNIYKDKFLGHECALCDWWLILGPVITLLYLLTENVLFKKAFILYFLLLIILKYIFQTFLFIYSIFILFCLKIDIEKMF